MRGGEGFVLCYSITDRHSFDEIIEYREQIHRVQHREDVPVVLVGNKYDLQEHMRQVSCIHDNNLLKVLLILKSIH